MLPAPDTHSDADPTSGQPALSRRGLALLLPVLAVATGALGPALVDTLKLWVREPALEWHYKLHAGAYIFGLLSMPAFILGLALGLMALVLVRRRDPSSAAASLWRGTVGALARKNRDPLAAATLYSAAVGLLLFLAAGYKLNHLFFTGFKNQHLAALLLACLTPALVGAVVLATLIIRVGVEQLTRGLARLPVLRLAATLAGAALLMLSLAAGAATLLVLRFLPIVRIIDWRPLSYPSLTLGVGALVLGLVLWARRRRLLRGRSSAGAGRRVALLLWALVLAASWGHCFVLLDDSPLVRTALLRRAYGAARTMDLLTWVLDFDRDGYLSFFGGGDCDAFNPGIHPGAMEIPGNGVDDNCFGGDLSNKHLAAPERTFDHPLPPAVAAKKLNLVLITMDGLRADHVGAYGYKGGATPNLDALAKKGVVFERAYAQAPSTRYSIPSFHSSRYSSQVPRAPTLDIPRPIQPEANLMAEVLKDAGYTTGAALSYMVFARSWKMDQGFDFYDNSQADYYNGKGSPGWNKDQPYVLVDVAKGFLDKNKDKPFFLWVHFFEPHPPYVRRTKPKDFGEDEVGVYDGELAFGDARVGELLDHIAKLPSADRTVIAMSADHGRGLGEHGLATHGYDLFGENLHVPLVIHVPGLSPRRIKHPVALLDLLPTLVNLAGIKKKFDFEGHSLVPQLVEGVEPDKDRPIFSEVQVGFQNSHVINAITTRDYKLIYDVTYNTFQLYDLREDPTEQRNVSDQSPAELKRLKGLLYKVMERATMPNIKEQIQSSIVAKAPPTPGVRKVNFDNQIEFLGFTVHPKRPGAGNIIYVTWYIKALTRVQKDFKFIVQFKGKDGMFFDAKHIPVNGLYPATKWKPGEIIADTQHMRLPHVPQEYEVWIGFGLGHDTLPTVEKMKMVNTAVKVGTLQTY